MIHPEMLEGELRFQLNSQVKDRQTFADLGVQDDFINDNKGFLRIRIDFENLDPNSLYANPTIELDFDATVDSIHWNCEFNGNTILDKNDRKGSVSMLLLNRAKIIEAIQHHDNTLIVHAEFPEEVAIDSKKSFLHFFK
jgi:hypothetical protein